MDNVICHWEIPSENPADLKNFYGNLFNWNIMQGDCMEDTRDYHVCDVGENGVWGAIDKVSKPNSGMLVYITVDDLDAYEKKIVELGGEILKSKQPIKNTGNYSQFSDPHGNVMGIFQPLIKQ